MSDKKTLQFNEVVAKEDEYLKAKRTYQKGEPIDEQELDETRFGIALSGGGIRSATINMGLLRTLNQFKILQKADYLSTVSGGGYTASYVQSYLKKEATEIGQENPLKAYEGLFQKEHTDYFRQQGEYMMPGVGKKKRWNTFVLVVGYIVSTLMSWISPLIFIFLAFTLLAGLGEIRNYIGGTSLLSILYRWIEDYHVVWVGTGIFFLIFLVHLLYNLRRKFDLGISKRFNQAEATFAGITLIAGLFLLLLNIASSNIELYKVVTEYFQLSTFGTVLLYFIATGLAIGLGYFANPNAISFHRFYRNQLANAYLHFADDFKNIEMRYLIKQDVKTPNNLIAPYPLINTCLNLQMMNGSDENFKGAKASDYFILSPFYFGSKLTGYLSTESFEDYKEMTLPAATTISAAAVNPGMGTYSNKLLGVLMTILNIRLGFWISNPLKVNESETVWWPWYFFKELFSQIGTGNRKLNISDGGHIENLGVYELLRRRCRLILSIDAGADPDYGFAELELLTVRVRNELGLSIEFRKGHTPEEVIRPKASFGYSLERFAVADVYHLWDEIPACDLDGNLYKDENYKDFEVLVNYPDLKDAIKILRYPAKLIVRIIFRMINEFKEVDELRNQLFSVDIKDPEMVKALLQAMIFSGGTNERTGGVRDVLVHAIENEPEKMKPILRQAGLLSSRYQYGVKLPEAVIENVIKNKLTPEGIATIEEILLDSVEPEAIRKVYGVMRTFIDLLAQVKVGVEQKMINAFLLRKIEDEQLIKVMQTRGVDAGQFRKFLAEEPTDKKISAYLIALNIDEAIIDELLEDRNEVRRLIWDKDGKLKEENKRKKKKHHKGRRKSSSKNEFGIILNDLRTANELLNDEALEEATLLAELDLLLTRNGYPKDLAKSLLKIRTNQIPKVDQIMELVSERIEEQVRNDLKASTLVYIKSSIKAPKGKIVTDDEMKYGAYKYKIYHPSFPHESTADQFFDPVQWEAYYMLGQYLGADVLGVKGLDQYFEDKKTSPDFTISDLLYRFDHDTDVQDLFHFRQAIEEETFPVEQPRSRGLESVVEPVLEESIEEEISTEDFFDPEEELLNSVNQPSMNKKVVAGKDIDYTI